MTDSQGRHAVAKFSPRPTLMKGPYQAGRSWPVDTDILLHEMGKRQCKTTSSVTLQPEEVQILLTKLHQHHAIEGDISNFVIPLGVVGGGEPIAGLSIISVQRPTQDGYEIIAITDPSFISTFSTWQLSTLTVNLSNNHAKALKRFPTIRGGVIALEVRPRVKVVRFPGRRRDFDERAFYSKELLGKHMIFVSAEAAMVYQELAGLEGSEVRHCNGHGEHIRSIIALKRAWDENMRRRDEQFAVIDASDDDEAEFQRSLLQLRYEPFLVVLPFDHDLNTHDMRWETGLVTSREKDGQVKQSGRGGPRFGCAAGKRDLFIDGPVMYAFSFFVFLIQQT